MKPLMPGRRQLLKGGAAFAGTTILSPLINLANQSDDTTKQLGDLPSELGIRSPHVSLSRHVYLREPSGWSYTPLENLNGVITPSDLHFERHHGGIPKIDPKDYKLIIHGMVDRPLKFSLEELKRFPSVSKICFIECSGNGFQNYWQDDIPQDISAGQLDGLISTSEWIGVPLSLILNEAGIKPKAKWLLAEGQDAAVMTRSITIEKAMDDAIIAYAQNGEPLRPGMGYPIRLLLPGWEGNTQIKWLRRLEVSDEPFMTREETSKYSDATKDGRVKLFTFEMDVKSVITNPSFPQVIEEKGNREISGLAWSGKGKIETVEVSTNGGESWKKAILQPPNLDKCPVRFTYTWNWQGEKSYLLSRATDEKGHVQPMPAVLRKERGEGFFYHNNSVRPWKVNRDGSIQFALDEFI